MNVTPAPSGQLTRPVAGSSGPTSPPARRRAQQRVNDFIFAAAEVTASLSGFTWVAVPDAPDNYTELRTRYEASCLTGAPLPISSINNENSIYGPEANIAYRFWHDMVHLARSLDFTPASELQVAMLHLAALQGVGYTPETLEWQLFRADTVGLVYLSAIGKCFPENQEIFVDTCLQRGLAAAVLSTLQPQALARSVDAG